jgi:hypothetical protein
LENRSNLNNNFADLENDLRKASVIKERVSLISSHMYKQYLDHQNATENTKEMFYNIWKESESVVNSLKESFSSRSIPSDHIATELELERTAFVISILWHTITFKMRGNYKPQALQREIDAPLFSGRIIAFNGNFNNKKIKEDDYPEILEAEIASLYIPADKNKSCIIKIKHLGNREFPINHTDAPREFILKVIEIICGGGIYHEEIF